MATYQLQHHYESYRDGTRYGPWSKGDVVELDEPDAAWIVRDSPGSLLPAAAGAEDNPTGPVPAAGARPRVNGDPDNAEVAAEAQRRVHAESDARQAKVVEVEVDGEFVDVTEHVAAEVAEDEDEDEAPEGKPASGKKPARNRQHATGKNRGA